MLARVQLIHTLAHMQPVVPLACIIFKLGRMSSAMARQLSSGLVFLAAVAVFVVLSGALVLFEFLAWLVRQLVVWSLSVMLASLCVVLWRSELRAPGRGGLEPGPVPQSGKSGTPAKLHSRPQPDTPVRAAEVQPAGSMIGCAEQNQRSAGPASCDESLDALPRTSRIVSTETSGGTQRASPTLDCASQLGPDDTLLPGDQFLDHSFEYWVHFYVNAWKRSSRFAECMRQNPRFAAVVDMGDDVLGRFTGPLSPLNNVRVITPGSSRDE